MVRVMHFPAKGTGSITGQRTKIMYAVRCPPPKKSKNVNKKVLQANL